MTPSAHPLGQPPRGPDLVISSYTLGTRASFEARLGAARGAGFTRLGLRAEDYAAARDAGMGDADMLHLLSGRGLRVAEVEYVTGWGANSRDRDQRHKEQTVFHMARVFGVGHVNAGLLEALPVSEVIDAFAALCDRAGDLVVALEFMPYSGVPDLLTAARVVERAGRPNGALLVDAWHWCRAGTKRSDLARVPAERIVSVQLCDVLEHPLPAARVESLHHRLPPGRGYGDVAGMVDALREHGVRPIVVTVEVISDDLVAGGLEAAASVVMDSTSELLQRAPLPQKEV